MATHVIFEGPEARFLEVLPTTPPRPVELAGALRILQSHVDDVAFAIPTPRISKAEVTDLSDELINAAVLLRMYASSMSEEVPQYDHACGCAGRSEVCPRCGCPCHC